MNESGTNIWLLFSAIVRRQRMIFGLVVLSTLVAIVVSLLLPKWYEATAMLLPGEGDALPVSRYAAASDLPAISGLISLPAVVTPADVYVRMLKSRTITKPIIEQFGLRERYEVDSYTDSYLALMTHSKFSVTEEGLLSISVEDRNPDSAAAMANAFVVKLNEVIGELLTGRAKLKRQFIQDRIIQIKSELDSARTSLESFQRENKTIDFDLQTGLAIDQAVTLKVEKARVDIALEMEGQELGKENPRIIELQRRRKAIDGQLRKLESGKVGSSFFTVPLDAIPELKGLYESLYSRVKVSESLYEILLEQFEQAKIDESVQSPAVVVLDHAVSPEFRSRPRRTLIVGVTFALSLLLAIVLALLFDYFDRLATRNDEESKLARFVIASLFGWLPGLRRNRADDSR